MGVFPEKQATLRNGKVVVLRHLTIEDAPEFLEFRQSIADETDFTLQTSEYPVPLDLAEQQICQAIIDERALRLGAFLASRLIGLIGIREVGLPGHPWTRHVMSFGMMVLSEFWGQGVAPQLLISAEEHARKNNVTRLEAQVRVMNDRGVEFYRRMGYSIEGTRRRAALIKGVAHDEYYIAKLLD